MAEAGGARAVRAGPEAAVARRWAEGARGPLRLEDGRRLRVIFPGVPGGASGPDFRDAVLDAGGDYLRGDVEVHARASGWRAHRHHLDAGYARVVLHVVGENDTGAVATLQGGGRAIAVLVLGGEVAQGTFPPPFLPPCALRVAQGEAPGETLARMGLRRLRMKAARCAPLVSQQGAGQALYGLALETLGGAANREAFAAVARRLPLAALLERASAAGEAAPDRALALTAGLRGAAAGLALQRGGSRPAAAPGRRVEAAGRLLARLWPAGASAGDWPAVLGEGAALPAALVVEGAGRGTAVELAVNAVLPVALAGGSWSEAAAAACLQRMPAPGTYGKLRELEGWLGGRAALKTAAALQGGLLLHAEYCTQGRCGRCPLS